VERPAKTEKGQALFMRAQSERRRQSTKTGQQQDRVVDPAVFFRAVR
jgi:hypothetical protein